MCRLYTLIIIYGFLVSGWVFADQDEEDLNLEQSVCGLKEPFIFWMWSSQAGWPDTNRLAGLGNVEDISFKTVDGRILRGYQLKAEIHNEHMQTAVPKGYLLVLQGNAMLADQILADFRRFAIAGYDVYIYDYRGYGRSDGKRRLKAMINDYQEIISTLNSLAYKQRLIYAMSFGGIVLLNGIDNMVKLDRIVIDSTPSRLSDYGCPEKYDPINYIPFNCQNCMFIVGMRDHVVSPSMSRDIVYKAQQRGATVVRDAEFMHPFMDFSLTVRQRRMRMIEQFLLQQE